MPPASKPLRLLLTLLLVLPCACLLEEELVAVEARCGPRELSLECCLKQFPDDWERCTGHTRVAKVAEKATEKAAEAARAPSLGAKAVAVGTAVAVAALRPTIQSAERRGAALASDELKKVERAIERCARQADKKVNDYHFNGRSPSRELCNQLKSGERTTWAVYLGLFKHQESWSCLKEALDELVPERYLLHPRFRIGKETGKWEYMTEKEVGEVVAAQGWSGLKGTIEPDIIIMDAIGLIIHVYDLKFPCPETNLPIWSSYKNGPWIDQTQGGVYENALQVRPLRVSPRDGVIREEE